MAALRFAMRKLGSLQRPPVGVSRRREEQGSKLLARLFCDRSGSTSSSAAAAPCNCGRKLGLPVNKDKIMSRRLAELHDKREELYDLCIELDKMDIPGWVGTRIMFLGQYLSLQVDPRPSDPHWRTQRVASKANLAAAVFLTGSTACWIQDWLRESDQKEKQEGHKQGQ